ncbi:MAG: hypothetical protein IJ089_13795 [Clostridia bacterium]|nr:hypothetical protein [Clostridia bacterium]MBQ8964838.1 hypothetical protein [Clostridia bacterium]
MAEDLRNQVMAFLKDRGQREFQFSYENWNRLLIRSEFDADTDFIYLLSSYGDTDPHELGSKAIYSGVYSHQSCQWYDVCYEIEKLVNPSGGNRRSDIFRQISQMASDMVVQMVNGEPVEETEESLSPHHSKEYFMEYKLEKDAYKHFMNRTMPEMKPIVPVETMTSSEFVMAINHPEQLAESYARHYILKRAKGLNQFLWEKPQIEARIALFEEMPGEHHYRRAIKDSIHDEKIVRLEVVKKGVHVECRITASVLKRVDHGYYPSWQMDAQSRKEFESAFGDRENLYPADIASITYGKKVLYTKASVRIPGSVEGKKEETEVAG